MFVFRIYSRVAKPHRADFRQLPLREQWRRNWMRNKIMWQMRWWRLRNYRRNKHARLARAAYLAQLNAAIPGLQWTSFGGACPSQGYGTYRDKPVYYRFRHDEASLEVYERHPEEEHPGLYQPILCSSIYPVTGETHAGDLLDVDEQVDLLRRLVDQLQPYDREANPSGVDRLGDAVELLMVMRTDEEN